MFLKRLALMCIIGLGVMLVVIGGPRMMAGMELAAAQDVMRQIRGADPTSFQGVMHAIGTRRSAVSWDPGPRAQAELGELLLTLAVLDHPQAVELRGNLAEEALQATRAAIIKSPTQPFAWTRFAQATALVSETARMQAEAAPSAGAIGEPATADPAASQQDAAEPAVSPVDGPLAMAIVTGPWEANLTPTRVEMGLYFWRELSDFTRRLVAGQIFIAAQQQPERLAAVTRRQNALREVMAILLPDSALLQEFTRTYYYTQSIEAERAAEQQNGG